MFCTYKKEICAVSIFVNLPALILVLSVDNLCEKVEPRSGPPKGQA